MSDPWTLEALDLSSAARAGWLTSTDGTRHATPLFQPVATAGTLRTLDWCDLESLGYKHVLMNTYHLTVRPGLPALARAGGVKRFTGFTGSVLTDSGGYQAHSLAARRSLKPDGIHFTDHIEGGKWHFTPEFTLRAQLTMGVDFAMCLDVCTGLPATRSRVAKDMALTHAWAKEQSELWPELVATAMRGDSDSPAAYATPATRPGPLPPRLFGIAQGGLFEDLRAESIELINSLSFDGVAVGGLAVGEEHEDLMRLTAFTGPLLAPGKVHYLMGIGEPRDLLFAIAQGFDLFDCVQPTRMARHGAAYTRLGKLNIKGSRFTDDKRPLDERCCCPVCKTYSRSYIRHLVMLKEHTYARLLTLHNLYFYRELLTRARRRIVAGKYGKWWPKHYELMGRVLPEGL